MQIVRSERFVSDIRRMITIDLAARNPFSADRYLLAIDRALQTTARFPLSKQEHPNLGVGVRKIAIDPYVIL